MRLGVSVVYSGCMGAEGAAGAGSATVGAVRAAVMRCARSVRSPARDSPAERHAPSRRAA